jgi:hypothetical protein
MSWAVAARLEDSARMASFARSDIMREIVETQKMWKR